jgi:hypothetical protein
MKRFPRIKYPSDPSTRGLFNQEVVVTEKLDGANFRFQLQESGLLRFGDRSRIYEGPYSVPDPYQHAVRHIQDHLDRDALREALEDVEDVVFFGEAMHQHAIKYNWDQMPSFLGFDIWIDSAEAFRPPDAIEQIFEHIGLQSVNVFERERRGKYFDPDSYTIPQSAWYDGPAEGVIIRDKRGHRAKLLHPDFREVDETILVDAAAEDLAAKYATDRRFKKLVAKLTDRGESVTTKTLSDRVFADIVREEHKQLYHRKETIDMDAFRSAIGAQTRAFINDREDELW